LKGYSSFARYYDALTANVDYPARARYFDALIRECGGGSCLALDLACGTGSLTFAMRDLGYDMIGVDASEDMLSQAMGKPGFSASGSDAKPVLFLRQSMEELDLFGTIGACVCALDSLNHLPGREALRAAISRVSLFLEPGGVFVFDMNTPYKHREILADNSFVYDLEEVFCVWRNSYRPKDDEVEIALDFFERRKSGRYLRESERFSERAYEADVILDILRECGLTPALQYGDDGFSPPGATTQRIAYAAKK
jgi:SAM-dependent methyltransferase